MQGSYKSFAITLFREDQLLETIYVDSLSASAYLLSTFQNILEQNNLSIEDLSFLAIDQGPGAFTSLRVILSTVNGIAFAHKIPLIGIDGLDALTQETLMLHVKNVGGASVSIIALLNAYNDEVYYSITQNSQKLIPNCYKKIDVLLDDVKNLCGEELLLFTGNGSELFKNKIEEKFSERVIKPFPLLQTCSSERVGRMGLEVWQKNLPKIYHLLPLYLKAQTFAVRKKIN